MLISILICTRNRAASLAQTLSAMRTLAMPSDAAVELLIIDNGSTADTAAVVHNADLPGLRVRYVLEPIVGQVHARNRGLREAQGSVILFTDDDIRPPANWIDGMCGPILRGEADAVAGGVRMAPHLKRRWMSHMLEAWLACTDGIDPRMPQRFVGANMAFSRAVLEKVPAFDPELGPGALGFYDETLFSAQLMQAGYRMVTALHVAVEHHFDQSRLDPQNMLRTADRIGRSHAYMFHHWEHGQRKLPLLRLIGAKLRLIRSTLFHLGERWAGDGAPEWKLIGVRRISFEQQYLRERRRAHNYDRFGLVKRFTTSEMQA